MLQRLHAACHERGCCLDEANAVISQLAGITYNGQANPHILLIEQDSKIKELEVEVKRLKAGHVVFLEQQAAFHDAEAVVYKKGAMMSMAESVQGEVFHTREAARLTALAASLKAEHGI
jgi:hypothetical protein